jgi:hypothetical protein
MTPPDAAPEIAGDSLATSAAPDSSTGQQGFRTNTGVILSSVDEPPSNLIRKP